jgi:hypothetical protein
MHKSLITLAFGALSLLATSSFAAGTCEEQAAEKKLAGAAKNSFVQKCERDTSGASPACQKSATDKKLAGAAKASHIKKCMADEKAKKG